MINKNWFKDWLQSKEPQQEPQQETAQPQYTFKEIGKDYKIKRIVLK